MRTVLALAMAVPLIFGALLTVPIQAGSAVEPRPVVRIVASLDPLADSVADDLVDAGRAAGVAFERVDATTPAGFLEAMRRDGAGLVFVIAHGGSDHLRIGTGTVSTRDILAALSAGGPRSVQFLACDLDLPVQVGQTSVRTYGRAIDARIATVHALEAWSQLFEQRDTIRAFYDAYVSLAEKHGGDPGMVSRALAPLEPLRFSSEEQGTPSRYQATYYPCQRPSPPSNMSCSQHAMDDDSEKHAQMKEGFFVRTRQLPGLSDPIRMAEERGWVSYSENVRGPDGKMFRSLWTVTLNRDRDHCIPLVGIADLFLPGITLGRQAFRELTWAATNGWAPTVGPDGDILRIKLCTTFHYGILADGTTYASAELRSQIGAEFRYWLQFGTGMFAINAAFGAGIFFVPVITLTGASTSATSGSPMRLDYEFSLYFLLDGDLGWLYGGFQKRILGPVRHSYTFNPAAWRTGSADATTSQYHLMSLTESQLKAFATDPAAAATIERRFGQQVEDIPTNSLIDLADPELHALVSDGSPVQTTTRLPEGVLAGDFAMPEIGAFHVRDEIGCAGRINLMLLVDCTPHVPASSTETCYGADLEPLMPTRAHACLVESRDGTSLSARFAIGGPNLTALLEPIVTAGDPWCRTLLPEQDPLPGRPDFEPRGDCPYTFPAHLCGWGLNAAYSALTQEESWPAADFWCRYYGRATSGGVIVADQVDLFLVGTSLLEYVHGARDALIDLCRATGSQAGCDTASVGFGSPSGAAEVPLHVFHDQQINRYLSANDPYMAFNCHFDRYLNIVFGSEFEPAGCRR